MPICIGKGLNHIQDNVEGLRGPIGQNETLVGALQGKGYVSEHVVGVIINNEMVVLYVH